MSFFPFSNSDVTDRFIATCRRDSTAGLCDAAAILWHPQIFKTPMVRPIVVVPKAFPLVAGNKYEILELLYYHHFVLIPSVSGSAYSVCVIEDNSPTNPVF